MAAQPGETVFQLACSVCRYTYFDSDQRDERFFVLNNLLIPIGRMRRRSHCPNCGSKWVIHCVKPGQLFGHN